MNKDIVVSHAKKLRFLRKQADIKQTEISSYLGMSQQAYSKLENAETVFSEDTIEKIARFFKITTAEFERSSDSVFIGNNAYNYSSNNCSVDERIKLLERFIEGNIKKQL